MTPLPKLKRSLSLIRRLTVSAHSHDNIQLGTPSAVLSYTNPYRPLLSKAWRLTTRLAGDSLI